MKALNWVWGRDEWQEQSGKRSICLRERQRAPPGPCPKELHFPRARRKFFMNLWQALLKTHWGLANRSLEGRSPENSSGFKNHSKIIFSHKGKAPLKIHSEAAQLTPVEALLPDDPGDLFCAALVLSWSLSRICCTPHLPSYLVPTQITSENHTEREGNCLYQLMMSSAAPQLIKERGSGRHQSTSPCYKTAWEIKLLASEPIHEQHLNTPQSLQRGKGDSAPRKHQVAQSLSASLEIEQVCLPPSMATNRSSKYRICLMYIKFFAFKCFLWKTRQVSGPKTSSGTNSSSWAAETSTWTPLHFRETGTKTDFSQAHSPYLWHGIYPWISCPRSPHSTHPWTPHCS